jgi:hypothetical protein
VNRAPFGLEYVRSKRAGKRIPALSLVRRFTCKIPRFLSGRCWVRTSDPLLVSSISPISFRTGMSGNFPFCSIFAYIEDLLCPPRTELYRPGCSTVAVNSNDLTRMADLLSLRSRKNLPFTAYVHLHLDLR